jgi:hypothetical protein
MKSSNLTQHVRWWVLFYSVTGSELKTAPNTRWVLGWVSSLITVIIKNPNILF